MSEAGSHANPPARYGGPTANVTLGVLTLVSFIYYLDRMVIGVLIEPIKRALLLSDTQIGLISGLAFALFYALLGMPIARLADRSDKVLVLVACVALWSVMTALSGAAASFAMLFVARMMVGIGEAGCMPISLALIGERFVPERRPFAISVFQAGGLLGISFGMYLAGRIAEVLGWRMAFVVIGSIGLPVAVLAGWVLRKRGAANGPRSKEDALSAFRALFRRPAFVRIILGISCAAFASYSTIQWFVAFLVRSHGVSLSKAALISGVATGIGGIAGTLGGGLLAGRLMRRDRRWVLWLPATVYTLAWPIFVLALLVHDTRVVFGCQFVAIAIAAAGGGVVLAAVQGFSEPDRRATANAIMLMASAIIGVGLGPVAVGLMSDWLQPTFGQESLRWGLVASTFMFGGASLQFLAAAKRASVDAVEWANE